MSVPTIGLSTELSDCPFILGTESASLRAAGVVTVGELLKGAPARYEDRRRFDALPIQESLTPVCARVLVVDAKWKFMGPGRRYFEAIVEEPRGGMGGRLSCRWFHFPAIGKMIACGMELILYGKVKRYGKTLTMSHPEFEVVDSYSENKRVHLERIVPVYRKRGGLSQRGYRELIWNCLVNAFPEKEGISLQAADQEEESEGVSLWDLHFPDIMEDAHRARKCFAMEECVSLQLSVLMRRRELEEKKGMVTVGKTHLVRDLKESLPFELTESQKECVREIYRDMKKPVPMNRLLQGDVGSGKTLVSLCAMLMAVEAGYQVAMMAPTQILAEQHFNTCRKLLDPLGVKVALKTSSRTDETQGWGSFGEEPSIVVGTHALLFAKDYFSHLGLVVIDEQHKFGVDQRERLISQGNSPDVLVMTATPIPRTLTLTLYGDLDVSILREKPQGRGRVITAVRTEKALRKVIKFVKEQVDDGRQVYIVSPLVEESTEGVRKRKGKSAVSEYEFWKKALPHVDIALLHGRMSAEEKESVMKDFHKGNYSVLVSTTVIEVGVDVSNATIMIINNADQFGLSQLHQLRGRVGRGGLKSYCILIEGKDATEEGREKLAIFEKINDGFDLAEADFRLRGPGDILGTEQSGLSGVDYPEWLYDTGLITEARKKAEGILRLDPDLSFPENFKWKDRLIQWRSMVSN